MPVAKLFGGNMEQPISVTIREACQLIGISRSSLYEALANGKLHAVKFGNRTLIPYEELERCIAALPEWQPECQKANRVGASK